MSNRPRALPGSPANRPDTPDELHLTRLVDQEGETYLRIGVDDRNDLISLEQARDSRLLSKALEKVGVIALTAGKLNPILKQIETLPLSDEIIYVAHEPGWHCGAFVMPDAQMIGTPDREIFVRFKSPPVVLSRAGSAGGQLRTMRRFFAGQPNFIYAVCFGLVGPILELIPTYSENPFSELYADTTIGKTRLLYATSALWGAPFQAGSISTSWNATSIAIQELAAQRHGAMLGLDEVNKAGYGAAAQAEAVVKTVFGIASGDARIRSGELDTRYVRVALLSTTNKPIKEFAVDPSNAAPAEVRCITIPVDTGSGFGCWEHLPRGFTTGAEASNALLAELSADHGWIARKWVRRLARELRRDGEGVRARIADLMAKYLAQAVPGADGEVYRRATQFAVVYAAGQLACDWGILPFRRVGGSTKTVHERAEAFRLGGGKAVVVDPNSALGVIRQHMAKHRRELIDLDAAPAPHLRAREMNACPGFMHTKDGRRSLLVRGSRHAFDAGTYLQRPAS